ncbi:hypothetical protein B0H12DRAFT_1245873 [Mycena haematopus]|nr:hypothetical protein B0H12DRAFT_1245873 [Mycena haematopus]
MGNTHSSPSPPALRLTPAHISTSAEPQSGSHNSTWGSSGWGEGTWGDTTWGYVADSGESTTVSSESTLAHEDDQSDSTLAQGDGHSGLNWGNSRDDWYFHSHADCAPLLPCRIAEAAIERWVRDGFITGVDGEAIENMWAELEPIGPDDTLLAGACRTALAELKCHVLAALRALSHLSPRPDSPSKEPGPSATQIEQARVVLARWDDDVQDDACESEDSA